MMSSMGRPLIPPDLLMRSTAICTPTSAVLPPAAGGGGAGRGLVCAELDGLGLAEGAPPRRGYQHGGAQRARGGGAHPDEAPPGHFAAVPEVIGFRPALVLPALARCALLLLLAGSGAPAVAGGRGDRARQRRPSATVRSAWEKASTVRRISSSP